MNAHTESPEDRGHEEQLERYVLGRLSAEERAAFEARLAADPGLREALHRERAIREGVRQLGRADLKRRISDATRTAPLPAVPWGKIAALAAVIMIVAGIALWQRWFFPPPTEERAEPTPARSATADQAAPALASNESDRAALREEKLATPGASASTPQPGPGAKGSARGTTTDSKGERVLESGGIVMRDVTADRARQSRVKPDAAPAQERELDAKEVLGKDRQEKIDSRTYLVEVAPENQGGVTDEAGARVPDTVRLTVRFRGDSVIIAVPASVIGPGRDGLEDARITRVSQDSVDIFVAGLRIRGYLPLREIR